MSQDGPQAGSPVTGAALPSLESIRKFVTVADELHFTRAAERLFVSQPALSKQIRMLERQLGAPLFERDRQSVRLTGVGSALLPHARQVLAEWDAGRAAVQAVIAEQQVTLVVGMSTSPGRGGLLPAIRSRFAAVHPEAAIRLRQFTWDDPTAGLADETTDIAFVWLPLPDSARYTWLVAAQEPCQVALPQTHPLATRDAIDFTDLLDEPFLALPETAGPLRDFWLALGARDGRPPRIATEIASTDEAYEALLGGQGICLLAAGNAALLTRDGVITRPVTGLPPTQLALAWRSTDRRPLVRAYAQACRQATHPR